MKRHTNSRDVSRCTLLLALATMFSGAILAGCGEAEEITEPEQPVFSGSNSRAGSGSETALNDYYVHETDETHEISGVFGGFNGRSSEGPQWTNTTFISNVAWMAPSIVRYPGGTLANSWNWHQGGKMGKNKIKNPYYIKDLVENAPQGCKLLYVMNMVNVPPETGYDYTTLTDRKARSAEVRQAKITDTFEALEEFRKYGNMPIAIELGNELYFNDEADYGIYTKDPAQYITDVKVIGAAIRQSYPDLKILLCTSKSDTKATSGRETWNTAIYNALQTDAEFAGYADAVVQHHYLDETIGSQNTLASRDAWEEAINAASDYASGPLVQKDYSRVPHNIGIWITEYGLGKANENCSRWISGLQYLAMSMGWIPWAPKLESIMLHHITLSPAVLTADKNALSSVGIGYGEFLRSAAGASKATRLVLATEPPSMSGIEPVRPDCVGSRATLHAATSRIYGWKFTQPDGTSRSILLNPTQTGVMINLSAGSLSGQTCVYSSDSPAAVSPSLGNGIERRQYDSDETRIELPEFSFMVFNQK